MNTLAREALVLSFIKQGINMVQTDGAAMLLELFR